uniref:Aldo/keto reductase n=1 Tax=Agrobacterium albertimagni TaxID=147266 RepID=A0A7C1NXD0_9HYPH
MGKCCDGFNFNWLFRGFGGGCEILCFRSDGHSCNLFCSLWTLGCCCDRCVSICHCDGWNDSACNCCCRSPRYKWHLRVEGKIDQIGISLRDNEPDEGIAVAKLGLVASQQVIFNMFEQPAREKLFPAAVDTGTAIIARVPLDSGSLSGRWAADTYATFKLGSQQHDMFRGARFAETLQRIEALKAEIGPDHGELADVAMRYVLSHAAVSVIIPGMSSIRHVDMNVACSGGSRLPEDLIERLRAHSWVRNYYKRPARSNSCDHPRLELNLRNAR